jgi:superfamily II DNA or RNA helicase
MKASFVLRQPLARLPLLRNLIALRKVNTLVLVHRRQLMDQWRERPALFLGLAIKDIGQIGGGKNTQNGRLDLAVIQSLIRKGEVKDLWPNTAR